MKSKIYVVIQVFLLGALAYVGDIIPTDYFFIFTMILGVVLVVWAFISKRMSVNIFPEPTQNMPLITSGPYKYLRHPIYSGVLLITLSWIPFQGQLYLFSLLWIVLLVIFLLKINHEEKMLAEQYPDYQKYKDDTDSLIPFVY